MARRARREVKVTRADSQRDAWTGMEPYGVPGERAARRDVKREKCFDSSRAIFAKSEKKAGGRSGCSGPYLAMMSHLGGILRQIWREARGYSPTQGRCCICEFNESGRPSDEDTYAHCSMLASACNITARFLRLPTFPGSTVFRAKASSRGGMSGGLGALEERWPIDLSCPVRNRCTACRVRST